MAPYGICFRIVSKLYFIFRYKLERGSLNAFKREARNIIERDLPLILHRDNIIKVWTDKVSALSGKLNLFQKCLISKIQILYI